MKRLSILLPAAVLLMAIAAPAQADQANETLFKKQMNAFLKEEGAPVGAVATLRKSGTTKVFSAGRSDFRRRGAPRATDHMRIASVAKAFSGAVTFDLVSKGQLSLDDTIASRRPDLPAAWGAVTVRQLLGHTSGVPDYTASKGFVEQFQTDPGGFVAPPKIIDWVRADGLEFPPGSKYVYSNTDNIVIGLIAEKVSGKPYGTLLQDIVFGPLGLRETSFPTTPALPRPFIHGYSSPGGDDVSTLLSPSGAWASGAIVSTPTELNTFISGLLGGKLVAPAQQVEQLKFFPGGRSSPPGPGANSAGLAVFQYVTKCGTVFGHTGNFPGYAQLALSNRDGTRSMTFSINSAAPKGRLLRQLRATQETGVCALLKD